MDGHQNGLGKHASSQGGFAAGAMGNVELAEGE
jgi:hypothetical protein